MTIYHSTNEYLGAIAQRLDELDIRQQPILNEYYLQLVEEFQTFVHQISDKNFWTVFPKIMGIDSKLRILQDLLNSRNDFGLSQKEIIQIIEKDYLTINKECFGYKVTEQPQHSLIFNVL